MADDEQVQVGGTKLCRECKSDIPVTATRCSQCGVAQNRTTNPILVIGSIVLLILAAYWIYTAFLQAR